MSKEYYTQKAIPVKAYHVTRNVELDLPLWLRTEDVTIDKSADGKEPRVYGCCIRTQEGKMRAKVGDYIVQELFADKKPLRVLKSSHFRRLYKPGVSI